MGRKTKTIKVQRIPRNKSSLSASFGFMEYTVIIKTTIITTTVMQITINKDDYNNEMLILENLPSIELG